MPKMKTHRGAAKRFREDGVRSYPVQASVPAALPEQPARRPTKRELRKAGYLDQGR